LTTFIDHRRRGNAEVRTLNAESNSSFIIHHSPFTGRGETVRTIDNGSIAKKVLDDIHPTEKTYIAAGIAALQGWTSRRITEFSSPHGTSSIGFAIR